MALPVQPLKSSDQNPTAFSGFLTDTQQLASRAPESSSPEEILMVIDRLLRRLLREYQERIAGSEGRELEVAGKC